MTPCSEQKARAFLLKSKLLLITIYKDQTKKQNKIHFVLSPLSILHTPSNAVHFNPLNTFYRNQSLWLPASPLGLESYLLLFTMSLSIVALGSFRSRSMRYSLFPGLLIKDFLFGTLTTAPWILLIVPLITSLPIPNFHLVILYYNNVLHIYYSLIFVWLAHIN